ncbi:hypothetical protein SAMN05216483_0040 [Streptomyces sp. 2131.1]|nr:hypothetical protein SAMN05216483_0040 [Streptomyces sp. 2131.1]
MQFRKTGSALIAAAALSVLGLQGSANASEAGATAWPTGCSYGRYTGDSDASYAECKNANGGSFRAVVVCRDMETAALITRTSTAWKKSGISYAFCPPHTLYQSAGIETKAS